MRGRLIFIAGGATLAVGALTLAATVAYAAPIPTSASAVQHAPELVVPANYHPSASSDHSSVPAPGGLIAVAPESAHDLVRGPKVPVPASTSTPSDDASDPTPSAEPSDPSTPAVTDAHGSDGEHSATDSGKDSTKDGTGTTTDNTKGKGKDKTRDTTGSDG